MSEDNGSGWVSVKSIAKQMGVDPSSARKHIVKHKKHLGISTQMIRFSGARNQKGLALSEKDAKALMAYREESGFSAEKPVKKQSGGVFYCVQPLPAEMPNRIKIGFTTDLRSRMQTYRTICPHAKALKTWVCDPTWEAAALASIGRIAVKRIGVEVFEFESADDVVAAAEAFFEMMPTAIE